MSKRKFEYNDINDRFNKQKKKKRYSFWNDLQVPEKIDTIQDLIIFAYTFKGEHINVDQIKAITPALLELDNMIGLHSAKKTVLDMIMHFSQHRHKKNIDYLHVIVAGPPGCGKTTFCRILGKILIGLNILSKNIFKIVKRSDFIGKYLGQTAPQTEKLIESCLGGVMFIDEAYSLGSKRVEGDSYAKEAADCLNQALSEHKDDFCCMLATYPDELEKTLFSLNQGMSRRFPWRIMLEEYTHSELFEIFKRMLKNINYTFSENAITSDFFKQYKKYFKYSGGDIETFITKCKFTHTRNTFGKKIDCVLTQQDIDQAFEEHKKLKATETVNDIPFGMYT